MTKIGQGAFRYCSSLESVIISSKVKVESRAFCKCGHSLTFYTPDGNKTDIDFFDIKDTVLIGITKDIKEVVVPEGITEIEFSAFAFTNLEKVTIPSSIKKIRNCAFDGCKSLKSVTIPKNVEFGIWVFRDCTSLKSLTTHEGEEIPLPN